MKFKNKDKVNLPFNEEGIVMKYDKTLLWGFPYKVKITKATLSNLGEIADFKESQMSLS